MLFQHTPMHLQKQFLVSQVETEVLKVDASYVVKNLNDSGTFY